MRRIVIGLTTLGLLAACSSDSPPEPADAPEDKPLEVFTNYLGDDAIAFRQVLDEFEAQSGLEVLHVGTADFASRVQERIKESDPPDVALFPQPGLVRDLAEKGQISSMSTIDPDLVTEVDEHLADVTSAVSLGDSVYAVPWRVDVSSLVWYRPDVFEEWQYTIPTSIVDLEALTAQMGVDGFVPWCVGIEAFDATGWVGTDWIEDLVLRTQPLHVYDRWASGDLLFDDERIRDAFQLWDDLVLQADRHYGTTRTILNTPWPEAADPMFETDPGCLLHRQAGTWADDMPDGISIGDDVDVFLMPPSEEGDDDPVLLKGEYAAALTINPGVAELMAFLLDPHSGSTWAELGDYVSPHPDFDLDLYSEPFDRRRAEFIAGADVVRFDGSDTMPPDVGTSSFWDGIVEFVARRDLDNAVAIIDAGFPPADQP